MYFEVCIVGKKDLIFHTHIHYIHCPYWRVECSARVELVL